VKTPTHHTCIAILLPWLAIAAGCESDLRYADAGDELDAVDEDSVAGPDAASSDAESSDAAPGMANVTVHVRNADDNGAPVANAVVVFSAAAGSTMVTAMTDASGTAIGTVEAGGTVTVMQGWQPGEAGRAIVFGVQDGDVLDFGPAPSALGTMTVTLPPTEATFYRVTGPCLLGGSTLTTLSVSIAAGCTSPQAVLAEARLGSARSFLVAAGVTPTDGGSLTMTGTWLDAATATVELTGLIADSPQLVMERHVYSAGISAYYDEPTTLTLDTPTTGTATFATPPGFGDGVLVSAFQNDIAVHQHIVGLADPMPFDATSHAPTIATIDLTDGVLTWTLDGDGPLDAVIVTVTGDPVALFSTLMIPPDATSVTLPAVVADQIQSVVSAMTIDVSTVAGYDELRPGAAAGVWTSHLPTPLPPGARVETTGW
jgi:hypothetical protein